MANMGYCRFQNTFSDLRDCLEHMYDDNLSDREKRYRKRIIEMCMDIAHCCYDEDEED